MGKLTIQDIAKILVEKSGLHQREANQFATEMFAIILQRLQEGDQVKVKGLGTFKIIGVEARESVSVRTGERVVIEGHDKVSFTPDNMMKELVNKPFSQFETVVLNDGVEFSDISNDDEVAEPTEEPVDSLLSEPSVIETPMLEVAEDNPSAEENLVTDDEPAADIVVVDEVETEDEEKPQLNWLKWLGAAAIVLLLMVVSAFAGYHYALQQVAPNLENEAEILISSDLVSSKPVTEQVVEKDTVVAVAPVEARVDTPQVEVVEEPIEKPVEKSAEKVAEKPVEEVDPYAAKDERVRLGAYRIVGTAEEVVVQPGQTFYGICKAHLGPDMQCYVEVYNNLPQNPKIEAGQKIKIPKLQLKKKRN